MMQNISSVIIESMSDGLIFFDFHGKITRMNPAASELLGIKMEEIKNRTYFQLFMDDPGNDVFNDLILDGIQKGKTRLYGEVPFRRKDGRWFDFAVTTSFLRAESEEGEKAGILVILKNITKVKDTGVGITQESQEHIFGGFYHSLETGLYSTKKPFDFGAGGEGLDL